MSNPNGAEPLRVLMVSPRYFPYAGGTEIHTREVSRRLVATGHAVTVFTTDPSHTLLRRERLDGVDIVRFRAWSARADLHFAPALYPAIRRGRRAWDVVHVQGYHTLVPPVAMLAALHAKLPYVLTFHGGGHSSRLRQSVRGLQRRTLGPLLRRADRLIALADFELELFGDRLGIPREQFVVIPTGTDLPALDDVPRPPAEARQGTLIASVGRLERYKGHQRLIAALPAILREQPDARVWIAGSGPYEAELRRLAAGLAVQDRVEIRAVPSTDRVAMASQLSRAALVVLLSEYETQPAAVLEGLALGRPALVADTSGLSELAQRGLARAIPLDSPPEVVAAAVLRQLRDPLIPKDLRLPTWDECTASLAALYAEVVRSHARTTPSASAHW